MTGRARTAGPTAVIATVLVLLVAACGRTSHPPDRAGAGSTRPGSRAPTIDWKRCDGDFECATFAAPLDDVHPGGRTIEIAMVRRPASRPAERIGALFVNPGGPGGSAVDYVEGASGSLPRSLTDRFDIVGLDPRGVGRSTPLDCEQAVPAMYRVDPTIDSSADRTRLLAASQRFVDRCAARGGALLAHLGTRDVARDMDLARQAMGEEQLSFFGYSYGTALGQVYAELFPRRVRAMVLDGVVDLGLDGPASARLQADGFEHALAAFATACRRGGDCPLGGDPIGAVDRVTSRAERAPIAAPDADRRAGPAEVTLALLDGLYHEASWPDLAGALADAAAAKPDGSGLVALADEYLHLAQFAPYFATSCLDARWPAPAALLAAAKRAARTAPHFGEAVTTDYVRCSLWPAAAEPLVAPTAASVATVAPIVLVSTTGDPATPYASGRKVAAIFPGSRLVTHVGDGHTAALQGDACIDGPVTAYLVTLALPRVGLRCQ